MSTAKKQELIQLIDEALNELRPHLAVDGGNIEVVDIDDDNTVKIKWLGNCESCSMSAMTMRAGVEQTIKQRVPQVTHVVAVNGVGA